MKQIHVKFFLIKINKFLLILVINTSPSLIYSESKQPLNIENITSPQSQERLKHIAVQMEAEPKRYGFNNGRTHPINYTNGLENLNFAYPNQIYQSSAAYAC